MAISAERKQYISDLARGEWVADLSEQERTDPRLFEAACQKWRLEADRFFATVTDPHELDLFARLANYEMGIDDLKRVVGHPRCDAGTALMVYWRSRPEWYAQYATAADVPEWGQAAYELLQAIEPRYLAGAYSSRSIPYDPRQDGQLGLYPAELAAAKRSVPPAMYEAVT